MQYFRDSETGEVFAFEDDVQAALGADGWTFARADGAPLGGPYPATLVQTDDPTPPVYVATPAENAATRDALLAGAATALAPLQMALVLDVATDAERTSARDWLDYSRALKAIDVSVSPVVWPVAPNA